MKSVRGCKNILWRALGTFGELQMNDTQQSEVLSFEIISLYVKKSCRKCRGRGYHVYSHATEKVFQKKNPDGSVSLKGIPKEWAEYCSCVIKGLNRAAKQVRVG